MKKIILIISILSALAVACNSKQAPTIGEKPLTSNVPSDDKTKREGTPLSQWNDSQANKSIAVNLSVAGNQVAEAQEYTLLDRLYSTVWYQSESDYDDGRLETEEEFVFFNDKSEMVKREYENGRIDGRDEYSKLKVITYDDLNTSKQGINKDKNACIVRNIEIDNGGYDVEYEGYYLVDRNTLYIIEGNNPEELKTRLQNIINGNGYIDPEDKFVLSTKALN